MLIRKVKDTMTSYGIDDLHDILLRNKEYVLLVWLDVQGIKSGFGFYSTNQLFLTESQHWVVRDYQVYSHAFKRVPLLNAMVFGYVP